jgi:two-component system sensor histidine kinase GlrK
LWASLPTLWTPKQRLTGALRVTAARGMSCLAARPPFRPVASPWVAGIKRPRSVLHLILIGFALVALPLIAALVNVSLYVDGMVDRSHRAVLQAVQATQNGRLLVESLTAMERSVRQYQVVSHPTLYEVYLDTRRRFSATLGRLAQLPLDPRMRRNLEQLGQREAAVFLALQAAEPGSQEAAAAVEGFAELGRLARDLLAASDRLIDREVVALEGTASEAKHTLGWQAAATVPLAMLLAGLFTYLIARPIRQVEAAIRRLGDGRFDVPVEVSGPRDLALLGERLDWLRRRLVELERDKQTFLHRVSHELKTPLTAIREGSELLVDDVVGPLNPEQREVARIMRDNGLQLQRLIEDLLNFNVVTHGPVPGVRKVVALESVVGRVVANHKPAMRNKHAELVADLAGAPVLGDEEKLAVVVDNLLSNAVKYCPPRGRVSVRLAQADGSAVLDVTDTGPGFAPQDRERVFEAFFQGRAPAQGHVKGTGLGLSIAREYVHAHQGQVEIVGGDGGQPPDGAHLRVTLPLAGTNSS